MNRARVFLSIGELSELIQLASGIETDPVVALVKSGYAKHEGDVLLLSSYAREIVNCMALSPVALYSELNIKDSIDSNLIHLGPREVSVCWAGQGDGVIATLLDTRGIATRYVRGWVPARVRVSRLPLADRSLAAAWKFVFTTQGVEAYQGWLRVLLLTDGSVAVLRNDQQAWSDVSSSEELDEVVASFVEPVNSLLGSGTQQ